MPTSLITILSTIGSVCRAIHIDRDSIYQRGHHCSPQQTTVVIGTLGKAERLALLPTLVSQLAASQSVREVVVSWQGPADAVPEYSNPRVRVITSPVTSLNLRYRLDLIQLQTCSMLVVDDDMMLDNQTVHHLFSHWQSAEPTQMLGFVAHSIDHGNYTMGSPPVCENCGQLILPPYMVDRRVLEAYWSPALKPAREYANTHEAHCDDILVNLIAHASGANTIRIASPFHNSNWRLEDDGRWNGGCNSTKQCWQHRMALRTECLNDLQALLQSGTVRHHHRRRHTSVKNWIQHRIDDHHRRRHHRHHNHHKGVDHQHSASRNYVASPATVSPLKESKGVLAVFIVGLLDRVIIYSKIKHIVKPAVLAGYHVNVYLSLAKLQDVHEFSYLPGRFGSPEAHNMSALHKAVSSAGGHVALAEVLENQIDVSSIAYADHREIKDPHRLADYAPYPYKNSKGVTVDGTAAGKNVLRRFWWFETLVNKYVRNSNDVPDFVLITHDDDHWLGPLDLSNFASRPDVSRKVFSKNCKQWNGINEKTLLLGRDAVSAILSGLYHSFWTNSSELDEKCWNGDHSWGAWNVECYLSHWVHLQGMTSEPVDWQLLPTHTCAWMKEGNLCHRSLYACPFPEDWPYDDLPEMCPE